MDTLSRINPLYEKYGHLPLVAFGIVLILLGLFIRTDFLLNIVNFVLEILGWLGIAGGTVLAAVGAASVLFILTYMFLALASVASDLGGGIGEIEETGVEISWKLGLWLTLLGYLAAIAIQFVPLPFAEDPPE